MRPFVFPDAMHMLRDLERAAEGGDAKAGAFVRWFQDWLVQTAAAHAALPQRAGEKKKHARTTTARDRLLARLVRTAWDG
jgi:hypothetical protein